MDLHVLFMQRKERYEGEYGPEVLTAWDEYCVYENPEGFEKELETQKMAYEKQAAGFALIKIRVNGDKVREMCLQRDHKLNGEIKED